MQFAEATGDRQWIHVDPERARRESPYGATIAHGFLTLSLMSHFMREAIQLPGERAADHQLWTESRSFSGACSRGREDSRAGSFAVVQGVARQR